MIEETETGLNLEIVDQDGRSMFPDGAKEPFDRTRRIIQKLAVPLKALPNRVSVTGHTAATRMPPRPGYGQWELSADRANAVRQILQDEGLPGSHFFMVAGKADSQPLFPDDPHIAANRRVTITLMREARRCRWLKLTAAAAQRKARIAAPSMRSKSRRMVRNPPRLPVDAQHAGKPPRWTHEQNDRSARTTSVAPGRGAAPDRERWG